MGQNQRMSFSDYFRVSQTHLAKHRPIHDGLVVHLDANGDIQRTSHKSLKCESSYSTSIQLRSDGRTVNTQGNHGRYGRPDNVVNYPVDDWKIIINNILEEFKIPPFTGGEIQTFHNRSTGQLETATTGASITEIHQTDNFFAGSNQNALDFIHAMGMVNINRQQVKAYETGATWGEGSRFKSSKLYDKAADMARLITKGKLENSEYINRLQAFNHENGLVRFEIQFRQYLARNSLTFWDEVSQDKLNQHFMQELSLMQKTKSLIDRSDIPLATLGVYLRYTEGENVRSSLPRRTFYRHRKILLEYGIDIKQTLNVKKLPLQEKIITLVPAIMPDWYYLPDVKPLSKMVSVQDARALKLITL